MAAHIAAMLPDSVRTVHAPLNHSASHDDHEKSNAWFSYFGACMSLSILWLWGFALWPFRPLKGALLKLVSWPESALFGQTTKYDTILFYNKKSLYTTNQKYTRYNVILSCWAQSEQVTTKFNVSNY